MEASTEKSDSLNAVVKKKMMAGSTSGLLCIFWLQPLDFLKTRFQENKFSENKSLIKYARGVAREKGVLYLWSGALPAAVRLVPGAGLYFGTLEGLTWIAKENFHAEINSNSNLIIGGLARFVVMTLFHPLTLIKTRFESKRYNYPSIWSACKMITKCEGPRGFYQGYLAAVVKDVPASAIHYSLFRYFQSKQNYNPKLFTLEKYNNAQWNFISGACAGLISTAIIQPVDLLKTRMQVQQYQLVSSHQQPNTSYLSMIKNFKNEHIFRTLQKSFLLSFIKKSVGSGVLWALYEFLS